MSYQLTAVIERENGGYVSLCPELDIASQGNTVEEAKSNLQEAVGLFFETASKEEIGERLSVRDSFRGRRWVDSENTVSWRFDDVAAILSCSGESQIAR